MFKIDLPPDNPPRWTSDIPYGWICPKCGRVWGPIVARCWACNGKIDVKEVEDRAGIERPEETK